ncbi:histidine kinase [Microbacterium sp. M28]|uniref:sensor histidine kinase n=1 Tax=Microbacterium sp. M28 TaxID=2962064 RepID=UPI0021F44594|nr:histidine kinase [Microbacterium sp. M28]UYO96225.1 histidine kinase [Microbacterium sp. M28]
MTSARPDTAKNPWERFSVVMALIWLVFLIYPVVALLRSEAAAGWITVAWVALALFIVLYVVGAVRGVRSDTPIGSPVGAAPWLFYAGLIVCALLSVPAEGGAVLSFLPFIMSFAAFGLTRTWHWITSGASLIIAALFVFLSPGGIGFVTILIIIALLAVVNTVSTTLIMRSADAERLGLELATSEGREAVARDVHDLIGHSLTVVGLKSQLARRLIDSDPERAKAELADIEALTAEAIAGVRATVSGVRTVTLDEQLAASGEALRSAGIAFTVDGDPGSLSPAQALTATWILREATTNVLRHAEASRVQVHVSTGRLSVVDDGRGCDDRDGGPAGSGEGNGIRGMRERAAMAGAQFRLDDEPTGGTIVEVMW